MPPRTDRTHRAGSPRLRETVDESLVLALFDLANHLQRRGERLAETAGLTTQQWLVLLQIASDPNFPASARGAQSQIMSSDIARVRGVSRATISAVVTALKQRGLVREMPDPDDRRRRYLELTRAGAAAIEMVEPARRGANQRLLAGLDESERRRMLDYLLRCLAVLWELHEDEQVTVARRRLAAGKR